jgi:hypothetical protein
MAERVVVGFLTHAHSADAGGAEAYFARVIALRKKAEAHGARLCACEARSVAFDFAPDEVDEAIDFATSVTEQAARDGDASALPHCGVGIAEGQMRVVADTGASAAFAWGPPLVTAMALARIARSGQVLADPALSCLAQGELLGGEMRHGHDGTRQVYGVVLDDRRIWRRDAEAALAQSADENAPIAETNGGASPGTAPLGGWTGAVKRGDRDGVPARLRAIASLAEGMIPEALRQLEDGVQASAEAPPAVRSRAILAYAIGLAVSGNATEALLQALTALARAREGNELNGERACTRFLARLSAAAGEPEAALMWQRAEAASPRRP